MIQVDGRKHNLVQQFEARKEYYRGNWRGAAPLGYPMFVEELHARQTTGLPS